MLPYTEIAFTIAFAILFYKAGDLEAGRSSTGSNGILWSVLSILVSVVALFVFKSSTWWLLAWQLALFILIGVVRAARES